MVFIFTVVAILGLAVFHGQNNTGAIPAVQQNSITATMISATEVARHNTSADCWVIINNKVYNVTSLIPVHSGGPNQIIAYCGKDGTTAFDTKDGRGSHSQRAQSILNNYYVGNLN